MPVGAPVDNSTLPYQLRRLFNRAPALWLHRAPAGRFGVAKPDNRNLKFRRGCGGNNRREVLS